MTLSDGSRVPETKTGGGRTILVLLLGVAVVSVLGVAAVFAAYYLFLHQPVASGIPTGMAAAAQASSTTTLTVTSTSSTTSSTTSIAKTTTTTMMRITTTVRPTCSDGIRNQGEEEADCGGPCRPCAKSSEDVVACLSSKVTALYMRDDNVCIQCKAIRNYFGSSIARINIVDCDEEDNEEECEDMLQEAKDQGKLRGYPTWNLYGELYPAAGVEKIKALSGCL